MKKTLNIFIFALLIGAICALPAAAAGAPDLNFNNRLQISIYAGAGIIIPKEGALNTGPAAVLGMEWRRGEEALFIDTLYSRTTVGPSMLWTTDDARHALVRFGYKKQVGASGRWRLGMNAQTQQIDFGLRKLTVVSFAPLAEYRLSRNWAAQAESTQVTKKSGVRFGNFSILAIRYF